MYFNFEKNEIIMIMSTALYQNQTRPTAFSTDRSENDLDIMSERRKSFCLPQTVIDTRNVSRIYKEVSSPISWCNILSNIKLVVGWSWHEYLYFSLTVINTFENYQEFHRFVVVTWSTSTKMLYLQSLLAISFPCVPIITRRGQF